METGCEEQGSRREAGVVRRFQKGKGNEGTGSTRKGSTGVSEDAASSRKRR